MTAITQPEIDQQVFDLYDEYCHGRIDRREFLKRAGALGALAFALSLLPDYARADHLVHRLAHQGPVRHLSIARRQWRENPRLPRAPGGKRSVPRRAGHP